MGPSSQFADLFMAGHSSVETLRKLEIQTIGDLAKADPKLIELHLKAMEGVCGSLPMEWMTLL
mgnify:CR=1 FL=1